MENATGGSQRQLWPIFICYRRVDGSETARRLFEMLNKWVTHGPEGEEIEIDAYLDDSVPGVSDWKSVHRPYLERARALIVVCTPAAWINDGPDDWVHIEMDWWLKHRSSDAVHPVAPILIDPLGEGERYVPSQISQRWPDIQRISLNEREWMKLGTVERNETTERVRRQIALAIIPSGAEVYVQELEAEKKRARRLRVALFSVTVFLMIAVLTGGFALLNSATSQASQQDAIAASKFGEVRLLGSFRRSEIIRWRDIRNRFQDAAEGTPRHINLGRELVQARAAISTLVSRQTELLADGRDRLAEADALWMVLDRVHSVFPFFETSRERPQAPTVFSIELLSAGKGESILIHYGPPDDVNLVMINFGPRQVFETTVRPRLEELKLLRAPDNPLTIELLVIGDRDFEKTGGLERMLSELVESDGAPIVKINRIWFNIFEQAGGRRLRARLRELIDTLDIPLNDPFDHLVMREANSFPKVALSGGLEIFVISPGEAALRKLHKWVGTRAVSQGGSIDPFPDEMFTGIELVKGDRLETSSAYSACAAETAFPIANGNSLSDASPPNLASIVTLFRYEGRTFLHTADARGDHIVDSFRAAGVSSEAPLEFDLMSIPHLGSDRSVDVEFFQALRANHYLFSGDGSHTNPEVATIAMLVAARECDPYSMYFSSRDGDPRNEQHYRNIDAFFKKWESENMRFRRAYPSADRGSVVIDLGDPVAD